jgi:hypothetical protein
MTLGGGAGCEGDGASQRGAEAVRAYTTRGVVLEVGADAWVVHHEAIDNFVGRNGEVRGMDAMVMRFALGPDLRPEDVNQGEKLRFRFEADPERRRYVITEARTLPPETVVHFRAARPPGDG